MDIQNECIERTCDFPQQIFNVTTCKCECLNQNEKCYIGQQIFDEHKCECICPFEKLHSQCFYEQSMLDKEGCECVPYRKTRQTSSVAPPPPPPPPPPPQNFCAISAFNCTDMKALNITTCECQCTQFLPAECPTPSSKTKDKTKTKTTRKDKSKNRAYVIGSDGCPELTPKGKKYRKVRVPRRASRTKTKTTTKSRSNESISTISTLPSISSPADSCPDGQVPDFDNCVCMRM